MTLPAIAPQVITALRVTIGLSWLVVVAAEMIAGRDGLGFAVWDARNGLRIDLLAATMVVIGLIGVAAGPRPGPAHPRPERPLGVRALRETLLRLERASLAFGATEVLRDLSLEVKRGEFVAVVGPSGCGKTTLLSLCSGYLRPAAGVVERRGSLRMVFQQDGLFPWLTVAENIRLGLRHVKDEAGARGVAPRP